MQGDKANATSLVAGVWKNLIDGNWSVRGEGGTRVTQLARALVLFLKSQGTEISDSDAAEKIADMEDEAKKALNSALQPQLAQIRLEDAQKKAANAKAEGDIDVAALLG